MPLPLTSLHLQSHRAVIREGCLGNSPSARPGEDGGRPAEEGGTRRQQRQGEGGVELDSRHSAPSSSAIGRGRCLVALEAWTLRAALVMAEEEVEGSHVGGPAPARGGAVDTDTGEEEGPHRRSGAARGATGRLVGEDDGRHRHGSPLEAAAATFPGLSCSRLAATPLGQVRGAGLTAGRFTGFRGDLAGVEL